MKRRKFIQNTLAASIGASALGSLSAHAFGPKLFPNELTNSPFFKLSLAQWSLHKAIWEKTLNPYDFAAKAKELGFEGIEYVNQLYKDVTEAKDKNAALKHFIAKSNNAANTHEIQNVLIMIDGEGDLAVPGMSQRKKAIEKHKTWIEVAAAMGCHSIRINLFGEREEQAWKAQAGDSMRQLGEYAAPYNINVIVENHGYLSSNAKLVMEMLDEVNLANCGTLPDFGNFCLEKSAGERWGQNALKNTTAIKGLKNYSRVPLPLVQKPMILMPKEMKHIPIMDACYNW